MALLTLFLATAFASLPPPSFPPPSFPPPSFPPPSSSSFPTLAVVIGSVGGGLALLLCGIGLCLYCRRRGRGTPPDLDCIVAPNGLCFPSHWKNPPEEKAAEDLVLLPGRWGQGSRALAEWIRANQARDRERCRAARDPVPSLEEGYPVHWGAPPSTNKKAKWVDENRARDEQACAVVDRMPKPKPPTLNTPRNEARARFERNSSTRRDYKNEFQKLNLKMTIPS